jgi:hypothetical protein
MADAIVERLEMGMTDADFLRVLPALVAPAVATQDGRRLTVRFADGGELVIILSAQRPRRIAALTLPCMDVRLTFRDCPDGFAEAFAGRFDRAFHKGGG